MAESPRRAGRPRDTEIDERALAAARTLLVERGFEATTIQAIAAHAGIHSSAIYRRWPSRIELIEDAAFPDAKPFEVTPTGDLRRDLRRFIRAYVAVFGTPTARAAAAGLLAHHRSTNTRASAAIDLRMSARPPFRAILNAAAPGSVDPDLDPDDVFDLLIGAVWIRNSAATTPGRQRPVERIVDMIVRVLRPVPA